MAFGCNSIEPAGAEDGFCLAFVPSSTDREPTANGRAAQETARALQLCTTPATFGFVHGLLLAFTAKHEATRCLR